MTGFFWWCKPACDPFAGHLVGSTGKLTVSWYFPLYWSFPSCLQLTTTARCHALNWFSAVNMDKDSKEHYDTIAMNEYRTIRAHSVHLDLPKPKKSRANAKNEHGNSWPFSALGQLHQKIVQTRILSCKRWLPNVHSHLLHKNCPLRTAIMKKEPGDEDESEEEIMLTWCTHHFPPKKHPRKSKNRRETKKNGDRKSTCN